MERLIDADKINYHDHTECMGHGDFETVRTVTDKEIAEIPTVYAAEVVRCRDCTYWGDEDGKLQDSDGVLFARCKVHNYLIDGIHNGWCPTENDFCSYGERKGGSGNG